MSAFFIWNPVVPAGALSSIEFVLTNGVVAPGIFRGKDFVLQLLRSLGLRGVVETWSFEPCRSIYYSEYLDDDDWRSVWPVVWKCRIVTAAPVRGLRVRPDPLGTDATGKDLWTGPSDEDPVECLVVADFSSAKALEKAKATIEGDEKRRKLEERSRVAAPRFALCERAGKYAQLQVLLGKLPASSYATGAKYAAHVMHSCEKDKGTTHFEKRV